MNYLTIIHGKAQIEFDPPYVRVHFSGSELDNFIDKYFIFAEVRSVCNLSDYPTKAGFRIFCRISSHYEEYAWSLSDFNISDPMVVNNT